MMCAYGRCQCLINPERSGPLGPNISQVINFAFSPTRVALSNGGKLFRRYWGTAMFLEPLQRSTTAASKSTPPWTGGLFWCRRPVNINQPRYYRGPEILLFGYVQCLLSFPGQLAPVTKRNLTQRFSVTTAAVPLSVLSKTPGIGLVTTFREVGKIFFCLLLIENSIPCCLGLTKVHALPLVLINPDAKLLGHPGRRQARIYGRRCG